MIPEPGRGGLAATRRWLAAGLIAVVGGVGAAPDPGADDWPEEFDLAERIAAVNEGELAFVTPASAAGHHAHDNRIRISVRSLEDGWVALEQCHQDLDAVPAAQVVFRADGIRNLTVSESRNIGRVWVEGASVQMEDVGHDARLCIRAESRALHRLGEGHYRLRNGPYMRRFLDGYYPMRVELHVSYPADQLRPSGQSPPSQPGLGVRQAPGTLDLEATFEGRLITCLDFCKAGSACDGAVPPCN